MPKQFSVFYSVQAPLSLATVPGFCSLIPSLSLSRRITKPLSPSSLFLSESPNRCHQALLFSPNHQAAITKPLPNADSPSPISKSLLLIHSSYKPNTLDTHLTFHSITLSSNRDSQGFSRVCGFGLKFCFQNLKRSSVGLSNQIKIKIKIKIKAIYLVGFDPCASFCVCVSFLFLEEKGGFSLCLGLGFDLRIVVDVCKGGI